MCVFYSQFPISIDRGTFDSPYEPSGRKVRLLTLCFPLYPPTPTPSNVAVMKRTSVRLRFLGLCEDCGILRFPDFWESSYCALASTQFHLGL